MPATSGAIWKPNLSSATTTVKSSTIARTVRTISLRIGGSSAQRSSGRATRLPAHHATRRPTPRSTRAPSTWNP